MTGAALFLFGAQALWLALAALWFVVYWHPLALFLAASFSGVLYSLTIVRLFALPWCVAVGHRAEVYLGGAMPWCDRCGWYWGRE